MHLEADRCNGCGGQLSETTDRDSEGRWEVPPPTRCHRCTAMAIAQEKDARHHPQALLWAAHRR